MTITNSPVMYDTTAAKLQYSANGTQTDVPGIGGAAAAGSLTGTTLASGVVSSSLTSVGTLATGTWNATTIAVNKGGTGQTTYTNGQILIGNTTGNTLSKATLTAGSGISITNGAGSITIAATGASSGNTFNVLDYGADPTGATSSQTAFANAISAARTSIGGPAYASNVKAAIVRIPKGIYAGITSLDCTNTVGLSIQGEGSWGSAIYADGQTTAGPVFDFTGSSYVTVKGISVFGCTAGGAAPTVKPLAAFLLAETTTGGDSNVNRLDDCQGIGYFNSAPLCIIGSPCNQLYSCRFQQWGLSNPALNLSTTNDWGITSLFKTIATSSANVGKNQFFGCEFHGAKSASAASWTLYFRNLDTASFHGCLIDNSASGTNMGHILVQGTGNNKLNFFGSSFYTESGHSAGSLLYVDNTLSSTLGSFLTHGCTEVYSGTRLIGTAPGSVSNL